MIQISVATAAEQIAACFPVIHELRPHLTLERYLAQVSRQQREHGYELAYVESSGSIEAVAGYRFAEFLAWGKVLYVDDLITASSARRSGFGGALLDWLIERAAAQGCAQIHLDSGVHRYDAHRLYMSRHMIIGSHHFSRDLAAKS